MDSLKIRLLFYADIYFGGFPGAADPELAGELYIPSGLGMPWDPPGGGEKCSLGEGWLEFPT